MSSRFFSSSASGSATSGMSSSAAAAAAAALTLSMPPNSNQPNSDLASLFECPVCFDYVLPPILQVFFQNTREKKTKIQFHGIYMMNDFYVIYYIKSIIISVSRWSSGLFILSSEINLLSYMSRSTWWQYSQFSDGKSGLHCHVSMPISILWLWSFPITHRQNRSWRNVWI